MPVRNHIASTSRKRLILLVLAGVVSFVPSLNANESESTQAATSAERRVDSSKTQAQPAGGPFERFRVARRPLVRPAPKPVNPIELGFRAPKVKVQKLDPNLPKPPSTESTSASPQTGASMTPPAKSQPVAQRTQGWAPRFSSQTDRAPLRDPDDFTAADELAPPSEPARETASRTRIGDLDGWAPVQDEKETAKPALTKTPKKTGDSAVTLGAPTATKVDKRALPDLPGLNAPKKEVPQKDIAQRKEKPVTSKVTKAVKKEEAKAPESVLLKAPAKETAKKAVVKKETSILGDLMTKKPPMAEEASDLAKKPKKGEPAPVFNPSYGDPKPIKAKEKAQPEVASSPQRAKKLRLDYAGWPKEPIQINSQVARMKPGIERVLQRYYDRPEIADGRSNWGMMHAMMVYGIDTRVRVGRTTHSTIAWLAGNNVCRGKRLLVSDGRNIRAREGIGLQGHQAQFLAIMSLCGVPRDYPLYASGKKFSVDDLIKTEMADCNKGDELTFTLIALSHYLDTDTTWIANSGEQWDIPRLIREELTQPIVGAACGGTHRLMAYTHALRNRRIDGKPITGQWARAEKYTNDFVDYAYGLQNRDGSMSTRWMEGRGNESNVDRKIQTTGHIVEWLLTVTPDSELQNRRLVAAVQYLLWAVSNNAQTSDKQVGPKGHALRSLAMYYDRVYQQGPAWKTRPKQVAGSRSTTYR